MSNRMVDPNAKSALNQMKMEIANELGINNSGGANLTSYENGKIGGDLGGLMSKQLVKMGEEELIRQYYNK
ncbi:MAG: alpha/beta-type small acid-soluble spore protein [Terrisporobacter sp.]|uniref:alpha/beta-type small acid-soluble spore protein n=1 Tax=Terrisporobacter sp. TaxID=1965305 RepID=UPI002FC979DC